MNEANARQPNRTAEILKIRIAAAYPQKSGKAL